LAGSTVRDGVRAVVSALRGATGDQARVPAPVVLSRGAAMRDAPDPGATAPAAVPTFARDRDAAVDEDQALPG
jgi:hypothetical protein